MNETPEESTPEQTPEQTSAEPLHSPGELPKASFTTLVTTLASQALATLGQIPGPDGKPAPPEPAIARHLIDTLDVLVEKTAGNLDNDEAAMLENVLHQLRMMYVEVTGSK